jgi:hypothetical protein
MIFRRLTIIAAAATALLLAACATGPKPEAFVAEACMEATTAESLAERSAQNQEQLASQLEEHQARLVELQRMRSRIVTGRMTDEELAQWTPERLPWEAEPEPEPEPVDTVAAESMSESPADTAAMAPSDSMMTTSESDTTGGFESYDAAGDTTEAGAMPDEMEAGSDTTGAGSSLEGTDETGSTNGDSVESSDQMNEEAPADTGTDATTGSVEDSGGATDTGDGAQAPDEQSGDQSDSGTAGEESTDTGGTP